MRYFFAPLAVIAVLFSTPVVAEEITMVCTWKDETRTLKYVNPLIGPKKILQRFEGAWVSWDRYIDGHHRPLKTNHHGSWGGLTGGI